MAQCCLYLVKKLRRISLEPRVLPSGTPDTVNDVVPFFVFLEKAVDRIDIILQIRIERDDGIRRFGRGEESGQKRILVSAIPGQSKSRNKRFGDTQLRNLSPSQIAGTVVDKDNPTDGRDTIRLNQRR